jgi:hypothetical protein
MRLPTSPVTPNSKLPRRDERRGATTSERNSSITDHVRPPPPGADVVVGRSIQCRDRQVLPLEFDRAVHRVGHGQSIHLFVVCQQEQRGRSNNLLLSYFVKENESLTSALFPRLLVSLFPRPSSRFLVACSFLVARCSSCFSEQREEKERQQCHNNKKLVFFSFSRPTSTHTRSHRLSFCSSSAALQLRKFRRVLCLS